MLPAVPVAEPGLPEEPEDQLVHVIVSARAMADVETAQAARRSTDTGFTSKRFSCIVILLYIQDAPGGFYRLGDTTSQLNF
jgi:hypothetical protein